MLRRLPRGLLSRNSTCAKARDQAREPRATPSQSVSGGAIAGQQSDEPDEIVAIPVAVHIGLACAQSAAAQDAPVEARISDPHVDERLASQAHRASGIVDRQTSTNERTEPRRQQPSASGVEPPGVRRDALKNIRSHAWVPCFG